jgi:translation initiation factor 2B subunit (eIF-2B alpha/beta/delta family)
MLQRGIEGVEILALHYRHCSQPLASDLDEIKWHIGTTKANMIIIDSQGLAAGGELKETQPAISFYAGLRALKVTSLILAHNSKDKETKARTIYGNQYFTAQARNIWEVRKNQEADSHEMDIALFHRKPPPFAGLHKPLGFKIIFDDDAGKMDIRQSDPKTVAEFMEQMSLKSRILEELKGGAMSIKDLAETLDVSTNQIKARCNDLKQKRRLVKVGEKWGLNSNEL